VLGNPARAGAVWIFTFSTASARTGRMQESVENSASFDSLNASPNVTLWASGQ
jgi:hypothetical protein